MDDVRGGDRVRRCDAPSRCAVGELRYPCIAVIFFIDENRGGDRMRRCDARRGVVVSLISDEKLMSFEKGAALKFQVFQGG